MTIRPRVRNIHRPGEFTVRLVCLELKEAFSVLSVGFHGAGNGSD